MATNGIFSKVQVMKPNRSVFNLSYDNAFDAQFGALYPVYVEDCVPGDIFKVSGKPYVQMSPLKSPMMGAIHADIHYFFVPYRIIWNEWKKFITGGQDGTAAPTMPHHYTSTSPYFSLFDFLSKAPNAPGTSSGKPKVNALDIRAYWKIWNDYYRDENLDDDLFPEDNEAPSGQANWINIGSGSISTLPGWSTSFLSLGYRAWRKDLFTSALPWAQRGAPVSVPVGPGNDVDVVFRLNSVNHDLSASAHTGNSIDLNTDVSDGLGSLSVPMSSSMGSINIEDLREANALQRWLERNAVAGGRYIEQILAHFGVRVPDYRLQRPEFLGGVSTPILTGTVYQNSETTSEAPLGALGGRGSGAGIMKPFTYHVKEHGIIMGIMSIIPQAYYSQGVNRRSLKFDKLDFFSPEFENLGEQEIFNSEIYAQGTAQDNEVFGYAPRYYEYKTRDNEIHGNFRGNLAYWIPQRRFGSLPALNSDFVHVNPANEESLNNIFAVTDANNNPFYCIVRNEVRAVRPMSKFSKFNF